MADFVQDYIQAEDDVYATIDDLVKMHNRLLREDPEFASFLDRVADTQIKNVANNGDSIVEKVQAVFDDNGLINFENVERYYEQYQDDNGTKQIRFLARKAAQDVLSAKASDRLTVSEKDKFLLRSEKLVNDIHAMIEELGKHYADFSKKYPEFNHVVLSEESLSLEEVKHKLDRVDIYDTMREAVDLDDFEDWFETYANQDLD